MAEKKAVGHAYNIDFLNVVFAASSIFLFLSTIWMVWDDFDREWKNTQRQFTQLELEVTRQQLAANSRGIDKAKLTGLTNQLARRAEGDGRQSRAHRRRERASGRGGPAPVPREQGRAVRQSGIRRPSLRLRRSADERIRKASASSRKRSRPKLSGCTS